jgi:hypothetical protein
MLSWVEESKYLWEMLMMDNVQVVVVVVPREKVDLAQLRRENRESPWGALNLRRASSFTSSLIYAFLLPYSFH